MNQEVQEAIDRALTSVSEIQEKTEALFAAEGVSYHQQDHMMHDPKVYPPEIKKMIEQHIEEVELSVQQAIIEERAKRTRKEIKEIKIDPRKVKGWIFVR